MSQHTARIGWNLRADDEFAKGRYSRDHEWEFDSGVKVPASTAMSEIASPDTVDPEEALVAALASCHMMTFLYFVRKGGFVVESYDDTAVGETDKNDRGKTYVARVTLSPAIRFAGSTPTQAELDEMHHRAHEDCFIANSVVAEVTVAARIVND